MRNIKLTVAYDGFAYHGWQITNMGPSIEATLGASLEKILQHEVVLQAASRTDAGVHANAQIVNFFTSSPITLDRLEMSLRGLLPSDIAVLKLEDMHASFHPTLDCVGKEYHYNVCYGKAQMPLQRFHAWHYPHAMDLIAMRAAAKQMIGEHDFSAFCNYKSTQSYAHYIRHVHNIEIIELAGSQLRFQISGNNFLYKMVRNIAGTLVYVGCGKMRADEIPLILEGKERPNAGVTAPAHGLCLNRTFYV